MAALGPARRTPLNLLTDTCLMAARRFTSPKADSSVDLSVIYKRKAASAGRSSRLMSASTVASTLDVARGTVTRWALDGCPAVKEPKEKGDGTAYEFDIADVVRWLMSASAASAEAAALEASAAAAPGIVPGEAIDGGETKDMADTRKARAQANLAEMEEATEAYACVPVAAVDAIVGELLTLARQKHQNLGSQIAGQVTGMTEPSEVSAVVDDFVAGITTGLAFDMQALIRKLRDGA